MRALALLGFALLAACDPQAVADQVLARTAETVVRPVLAQELTAAQADAATRCVIQSATPAETEALSRDIGVSAGTLTVARIREIALRPAAADCFATNGVPPLKG